MLAVGDFKQCSTCKETKPLPAFNKCSHWRDGLQNNCRDCQRKAPSSNAELNRVRCRQWYADHKPQAQATMRAWALAHPAQVRQIKAKSCEKYREDPVRRARRSRQAVESGRRHPEQRQATGARYRARKKKATVCKLSTAEWQEILATFNFHCAYCLRPFTPSRRASQDHMIPLSHDGTHEPANVVPACRSCNSVKKDRNLLELVANRRLPTVGSPTIP